MAKYKVIGGEFEIRVQQSYQKRNSIPEGVVTYSSGRSTLYNVFSCLKDRCGIKGVLFPDYLCESVYQMAEKNEMSVDFYALDEHLNPDLQDLVNKYDTTKVVLLIDYFGLKDCNSVIAQLRGIHQEMVIVLDNVQSPYAMFEDTDADISFSSFRKAFPVADGSWALSKSISLPQYDCVNEFAQYKIAASYLKALREQNYYSDKVYLELYHQGETKIDDDYRTDMSKLSKDILSDMEWSRYAILRKRNAEVIVGGLKQMGIEPILPVPENKVPLFVPVRLENRDKIRKAMFANNVFLPVHWPVGDTYRNILKRGSEMEAHELSIIVDQRYSVSDMKRILGIFESNI